MLQNLCFSFVSANTSHQDQLGLSRDKIAVQYSPLTKPRADHSWQLTAGCQVSLPCQIHFQNSQKLFLHKPIEFVPADSAATFPLRNLSRVATALCGGKENTDSQSSMPAGLVPASKVSIQVPDYIPCEHPFTAPTNTSSQHILVLSQIKPNYFYFPSWEFLVRIFPRRHLHGVTKGVFAQHPYEWPVSTESKSHLWMVIWNLLLLTITHLSVHKIHLMSPKPSNTRLMESSLTSWL